MQQVPHLLLSLHFLLLYAPEKMQSRTDTLAIGAEAPQFSLRAANREGKFALGDFLERGPLILEFLRGTW